VDGKLLNKLIHDAEIEAAPLDTLDEDCVLPSMAYAEGVLTALRELARLQAAGWRIADDGDPYQP
jgi:hypothetical protein